MSRDMSPSAFPWHILSEPGEQCDPVTGKPHGPNERSRHVQSGLSIRDYFAAKAMTSINEFQSASRIAARAYEIADAMLAERAK